MYLSTVRVEKGMGLRMNLLWLNPQDGDGRIPEYWEESSAGTGMALTTAETTPVKGFNQPSVRLSQRRAELTLNDIRRTNTSFCHSQLTTLIKT